MPTSYRSDEVKCHSTTSSDKSVGYIIQRAIEAEDYTRDIYRKMSQMFAHVPRVSQFWLDLSYDEARHAYTLQNIRDSLSDEQLAAAADRRILDNVASVISVQNGISLDTVETLDEAYEIAHELEHSEINHIFECLAVGFIRQQDKRQILLSELREHQNKLMAFTQNFGDREWRRQITARPLASVQP